ncbi:hypothetical protein PoB_001073700 [Plakobranchus ocellatus]|uniref:Uncharacterized protein n=1 Tax=Plakobranchus ocellatus TaxID=259542 RepID=A0AAV3YQ23_9GAST|nr:hypothetical protein PoB_001073700 [Plakobranchus ocellatus]
MRRAAQLKKLCMDFTVIDLGTANGQRMLTQKEDSGNLLRLNRVMQLNIQGCLTLRHTELRTVLIKRGVHIVLAQETLLGKKREYSLPGKHTAASQPSLGKTSGRQSETYRPPPRLMSRE